ASVVLFFTARPGPPPDLHSFPTRRSSDLGDRTARVHRRTEIHGDPPIDHRRVDRIGVVAAKVVLVVDGRLLEVRKDRDEAAGDRSEEHTSELQSRENLVCRLLLEKKKKKK